MYFGDHSGGGKLGVHLEGQWRRSDIVTRWQQLLLRPALNYEVNDKISLSSGYGFIRTYPYGEIPGRLSHEHRLYQQASFKHPAGPIRIEHRLRQEERWQAPVNGASRNWDYSNRLRYRLQGRIPLRSGAFYLSTSNEVFANWGAHSSRTFDQNRAYGALGIRLSSKERMEIGYMHQYLIRSGGITEHNHTLQLSLFSERAFR